jgi:hypoxanthine phosphoribosyltransferase
MDSPHKLHTLISRGEIEATVKRLAAQISADYRGKELLVIGVLKGSFMFLADLVRGLDLPLELDFVRLSSYGSGRESPGKVKVVQGLRSPVRGKHVLVVEDVIDSGITVNFLISYLKKKRPASLRLCALTDKPSRRRVPVNIDYIGREVPDKFIVGYGLDCDEKYRNLPDICYIEEEKECRTTSKI